MSQTIVFDGGSDADRTQVVEALHAYLHANSTFDWRKLARIWSHDPNNVFFNMNGHTYVGLEQWTRLWRYYSERVDTGLWEPYDISVMIRGDVALVTCHRRTQRRWKGREEERLAYDVDTSSFVSRSTMVMVKESGGWKTVHAHFSQAAAGPRPGNV
jgi:ketosteroid isomerase-like protein